MAQQGDVILHMGEDGFDFEVIGGLVTMGGGLGTAAMLSIFGGNAADDGSPSGERYQFWGNHVLKSKFRSKTLWVIENLPMTTGNALTLEDAVRSDLGWMISSGVASKITVSASLSVGRVDISVNIISPTGDPDAYKFSVNWSNTP